MPNSIYVSLSVQEVVTRYIKRENYYIKWGTNSWTYSIYNLEKFKRAPVSGSKLSNHSYAYIKYLNFAKYFSNWYDNGDSIARSLLRELNDIKADIFSKTGKIAEMKELTLVHKNDNKQI